MTCVSPKELGDCDIVASCRVGLGAYFRGKDRGKALLKIGAMALPFLPSK